MSHFPVKFAAVAVMALSLTAAAKAADSVHIAVDGVQSQAQLAQALSAQGYSDIALSAVAADPTHPHPELNPDFVAHPQATPVRSGWNGVAVKDGKTVQIYADLKG